METLTLVQNLVALSFVGLVIVGFNMADTEEITQNSLLWEIRVLPFVFLGMVSLSLVGSGIWLTKIMVETESWSHLLPILAMIPWYSGLAAFLFILGRIFIRLSILNETYTSPKMIPWSFEEAQQRFGEAIFWEIFLGVALIVTWMNHIPA